MLGLLFALGLPLVFGLPLALGLAAADDRIAVMAGPAAVPGLAAAVFGRDVPVGFAARAERALDADPDLAVAVTGLAAVPDLAVPDFAVPDLVAADLLDPVFALAAACDFDAA